MTFSFHEIYIFKPIDVPSNNISIDDFARSLLLQPIKTGTAGIQTVGVLGNQQ